MHSPFSPTVCRRCRQSVRELKQRMPWPRIEGLKLNQALVFCDVNDALMLIRTTIATNMRATCWSIFHTYFMLTAVSIVARLSRAYCVAEHTISHVLCFPVSLFNSFECEWPSVLCIPPRIRPIAVYTPCFWWTLHRCPTGVMAI